MHQILQQAASNAAAMGPTILLQGMQIELPLDVVKAAGLTVDDKRTYWRHGLQITMRWIRRRRSAIFPERRSQFPSMSFRLPFENLTGAMASDDSDLRQPVSSTSPIV